MTAESLHRLFHPDRVAVIGASERPGSVGDMVLRKLDVQRAADVRSGYR